MNAGGRKVQTDFAQPSRIKHCDNTTFSVAADNTGRGNTYLVCGVADRRSPNPKPNRSRKHRYRDKHNIKPWQASDIVHAAVVARRMHQPFNLFITINHQLCDHGGLDAKAFQRATKRMSQWLRDNGAPVLWAYVHENPVDDVSTYAPERFAKPNTHMLIRVPSSLAHRFIALLPGWFDAWAEAAIHTRSHRAGHRGDKTLNYMLKGADYLTCRRNGGYRKTGGQGEVHIKRTGVSGALRKAMRNIVGRSERSRIRRSAAERSPHAGDGRA